MFLLFLYPLLQDLSYPAAGPRYDWSTSQSCKIYFLWLRQTVSVVAAQQENTESRSNINGQDTTPLGIRV
jgi:hypothetical protein